MTRSIPLVVLAACASAPGGDYTLTVTPQLAPGHGPLDSFVVTVTLDGGAPVEAEGDGRGGGTWVGAPALDGAHLDLAWWPDDAVAQGTPRAHGTAPAVTLADGELEVRPWVAEVGRVGSWDALGDGYATVGAAAAVLADGDLLVLGGSDPGTLGDPRAAARATVLRAARDGVPRLVEVGALPPARVGDDARRTAHTVTRLEDGTLLVAGGRRSWVPVTASLDSAVVLDPDTLEARTSSVFPGAVGRSGHAAVPRADGVWLLGGFTGTATLAFTTVRWSPDSNVWTDGPDLVGPGPIGFGHAVLDDGTVVVCGGASATITSELVPSAGCAALDPSGTATTLPALPAARQGLTLAAVGPDAVIAVGGTGDFLVFESSTAPLGAAEPDAWRLTLGDAAWEPLPDLTTARAHARSAPIAPGIVLLVGGADAAAGVPPLGVGGAVDAPERYDDTTRTFTRLEGSPATAGAWPVVAHDPRFGVYVLAGASGVGATAAGGRVWGWLTPGPAN